MTAGDYYFAIFVRDLTREKFQDLINALTRFGGRIIQTEKDSLIGSTKDIRMIACLQKMKELHAESRFGLSQYQGLAKGLAKIANFGELLISEEIEKQTIDHYALTSLGMLTIEGMASQILVCRVEQPVGAVQFPPSVSIAARVSRENELDALKNLIRVSNGILITGQPGSGKTAIIEELLDEYHDRQIYRTFCSAYPPGRTFKPVTDIVAQIFEISKLDSIERKQKAVEQKLKDLDVGDIGTFYLAILDFLGLNEEESILEKIELPVRVEIIINSIAETLRHISWNRPVVILVDDAENLDASSLNFIQNLMYKLIEENILFLLSSSLPQINIKGIKEFELRSIDMKKLETIVADVTDETINLPPTTPLHIAQYLRLYEEEKCEFLFNQYRGHGTVTSFSIAFHDLRTVIKRRLELLDQEKRELIYSLAVIGNEINPAEIPIGEKAYLLDHLTDRHYLRFYQNHYAFASPQLHAGIYNLVEDKKTRHLHFADYYRRLAGFEDVAAFHYLQGENYKRSIEFFLKAAAAAIRRGGHESGIFHYNQALELCQRHKDVADLEVLVALNEGLADVYRALGNEEKALKYYKVVLDSYKEILKE